MSPTTFEIFKFEDLPPPVGVKTKMYFHVSRSFLALGLGIFRESGVRTPNLEHQKRIRRLHQPHMDYLIQTQKDFA